LVGVVALTAREAKHQRNCGCHCYYDMYSV
jgi:hypothetical protein